MSQVYIKRLKERLDLCTSNHREALYILKTLLSEYSNVPYGETLFMMDDELNKDQRNQIEEGIVKLQQGMPIQHIVGRTDFFSLSIYCSPEALIPRPETEELVAWILEDYFNKEVRIVDLCTGTGCIALALKSKLKIAKIEAIELSIEALNLAKRNADNLKLEVDFQHKDVLETNILEPDTYDVWVSNPPYIPNEERKEMEGLVVDHEPGMALFVPDNSPFIFYEALAREAMRSLKNNGHLYVEIHEGKANEVVEIFTKFGLRNMEVRKDLQDKDRMIRACK